MESTPVATPNNNRANRSSILGLIGRKKRASASIHIENPQQLAALIGPSSPSQEQNSTQEQQRSVGRKSPAIPTSPGPTATETPMPPPANEGSSTGGLASRLMKRRSLGAAVKLDLPSSDPSGPSSTTVAQRDTPASTAPVPAPVRRQKPPKSFKIRLVPHLASTRSLQFEPIVRTCKIGGPQLKIGRFIDEAALGMGNFDAPGLLGTLRDDKKPDKFAFKSKVVSRNHAAIWVDANGQFWIKDTSSSSGTFLNHLRLSPPHKDSAPQHLRDGDTIQLGVDYQGGTEEQYRSVRIKVELGPRLAKARDASTFNNAAMNLVRSLQGHQNVNAAEATPALKDLEATKSKLDKHLNGGDCCICLFPVTVCQAVFISPCSHAFHYKCVRPLLELHHPGFSCAMCRTYADLNADVERLIDEEKDESEDEGDDLDDDVDVGPVSPSGATPQSKQEAHDQSRVAETTAHPAPVRPHNATRTETEAERSDREERRLLLERLEREALETALEVSRAQYEADMTMRSEEDPRWEGRVNNNPFTDGRGLGQPAPQQQSPPSLAMNAGTSPPSPLAMPGGFAAQQYPYADFASLDAGAFFASPMTRVNSPFLQPVDGTGAGSVPGMMMPVDSRAFSPFPGAMPGTFSPSGVRSPSSTIVSRSPLSTSPPDTSHMRPQGTGLGDVAEGEGEARYRGPDGWGSRTPETHTNLILPADPSGVFHPSV